MIPEHRPTRLPVFLASALSKLYSIGINHQNRKFDRGDGVTTLDLPVISIGNLSAGGTGKTPLVQHVVRLLIEAGHHPAIAMRGYKAKPGEIGDEQREHMDSLPGVPIVAQPDRIAGLLNLFATDEGKRVDCVVLDDGFQHRKIARDLDIVVIDASRPPFGDALLPLGFLRESAESLERADVVVISHAEMVEQEALGELRNWVAKQIRAETVVSVVTHRWDRVVEYNCDGERVAEHPVERVLNEQVAVLTGIGHPGAFASMAVAEGAKILHRSDRPDHDDFSRSVVDEFLDDARAAAASAILTTNKDWTKLKSRLKRENSDGVQLDVMPVLVPGLGLGFQSGESDLKSACMHVFES